jgi:hypothetical protein
MRSEIVVITYKILERGPDSRSPGRFSGQSPPRRPSAPGTPKALRSQGEPYGSGARSTSRLSTRIRCLWHWIGLPAKAWKGRGKSGQATLGEQDVRAVGRRRTDPTLQSPFGPGGYHRITGTLGDGNCRIEAEDPLSGARRFGKASTPTACPGVLGKQAQGGDATRLRRNEEQH